VLPFHDRMPVVLEPGEIDDFLAGRMRHFKPPAESLQVADAANPLLKSPRAVQGELF
jgi:putative SOS response-associated peptidase YedK